jgi:hypothetical protein
MTVSVFSFSSLLLSPHSPLREPTGIYRKKSALLCFDLLLTFSIDCSELFSRMPHATDSEFDHIQVKQLAPTFGAEVTGIDFSKPVPPEVFAEIHRAITKVS